MNTGLLWKVPPERARLIPVNGYFGVAFIVWIGVPLVSVILRAFSPQLGLIPEGPFDYFDGPPPLAIVEYFEMYTFSWLLSWIGFVLFYPIAMIARHFGYIGALPAILIAISVSIAISGINHISDAETASISKSFSMGVSLIPHISVFAAPFWLITKFIWPEAFNNEARGQQ